MTTLVASSTHRYRPPNLQRKLAAQATPPNNNCNEKASVAKNIKLILLIALVFTLMAGCAFIIARLAGAEIALAGHTLNTGERQIIIGSHVITAPANMIRYPSQRSVVSAKRLDLYLHWPSMQGYSEKLKKSFNATSENNDIVFIKLERQFSESAMSARVKPIYQNFFIGQPYDYGYGLKAVKLDPIAGFIDEFLVIQKNNPNPYAARCLDPAPTSQGTTTTPYCIRDIHIANGISLTYRFHKTLLKDWQLIERTITARFETMIK